MSAQPNGKPALTNIGVTDAGFLDASGIKPIDWGFTVGRQPVIFQEGILINDTIDAVGVVRNNIPFPGISNLRFSAMYGWNRLDRNDDDRQSQEDMFGMFIAADTHISTLNFDMIYVRDEDNGDGLYGGIAAIQRLPGWGGISTAFRVNASLALEDEIPGNVVGNGVLMTAELSKTVPGSDDIVYFNSFLGLGNFTQAGREAIVGGPLDRLKQLQASNPNFHSTVFYSRPGQACRRGIDYDFDGHVTVQYISTVLRGGMFQFYVCGPNAMMDRVLCDLARWGVPDEDINFESFGAASKSVTTPSELPPLDSQVSQAGYRINFARTRKHAAWSPMSKNLLELAEQTGINVRYGCRAGGCGAWTDDWRTYRIALRSR